MAHSDIPLDMMLHIADLMEEGESRAVERLWFSKLVEAMCLTEFCIAHDISYHVHQDNLTTFFDVSRPEDGASKWFLVPYQGYGPNIPRRHRVVSGGSRQLPLPFSQVDILKNELIEAKRRLQSEIEENTGLAQEVERLRKANDGLLDCVARHERVEKGLKNAVGMREGGALLFSEEYRGRVAASGTESFDAVFDDGQGNTFVQTYTKEQLQGARVPEEGDWVYVFAAVYRFEPPPVSLKEIMKSK